MREELQTLTLMLLRLQVVQEQGLFAMYKLMEVVMRPLLKKIVVQATPLTTQLLLLHQVLLVQAQLILY